MQRFPSVKVGLASFLSCLVLLVSMLAMTGTASANTTSSARHRVDPNIHVAFVVRREFRCTTFLLIGNDFSRFGRVGLFANSVNRFGVFITPSTVRANSRGNFSVFATACSSRNFQSCGLFINNPFFFCGFGLSPREFCQIGSEVDFCFNSEFPQSQFRPISVSEFCRFNSLQFCLFRRGQLVIVTALDLRSGIQSNSTGVRIRFGFF